MFQGQDRGRWFSLDIAAGSLAKPIERVKSKSVTADGELAYSTDEATHVVMDQQQGYCNRWDRDAAPKCRLRANRKKHHVDAKAVYNG